MEQTDIRGLLGLSLRASRLVIGDEPVRELIASGHARALFVAADAGAAGIRKIARLAQEREIPLFTLPQTKAELGGCLGRASCAVCAMRDLGFAASAAEKLACLSPEYAAAAELLQKRNIRMQERKARPRKKGAGTKVTEYTNIDEEVFKRKFGKKK